MNNLVLLYSFKCLSMQLKKVQIQSSMNQWQSHWSNMQKRSPRLTKSTQRHWSEVSRAVTLNVFDPKHTTHILLLLLILSQEESEALGLYIYNVGVKG